MLILVGAGGFLGRHMCELLERKGERAVAVVRQGDRSFSERFAASLDVIDDAAFASPAGLDLLAGARAVVYFVWRSVPATFADEPCREVTDNLGPAFQFFQRVASAPRRVKIVFLSSGGTVYGHDGATPKSEISATNPVSPHGLGKLLTENVLGFLGRTEGVPYAILRISNAVGRWHSSQAQGIVGAGLRAARDGTPVRLFGGGGQVRDFVDADDVAKAIYAASLDTKHSAAIWNVGSGVGISMIDLMRRLAEIAGRKIAIESAPPRSVDVPYSVLDCGKIGRELGWKATTPIERAISNVWEAICAGREVMRS